MATVSFEGVRKDFGALTVVHDLDLRVADGELVVLVGGSGSGKSTTLRMLAGLEAVSAGVVRIGDRDVTRLPPRDRDVAMVFQDYALYPHLSARENIALGLRLRNIAAPEITRRVGWAADVLGLGELLDRRPKELSGGQRQRVAMGRAMVREPAVFLFDEPLSNLDAQLRGQMRGEILRLQRRLGTTTLYVTHDQVEAMTLADRLVILDGGRVQQVGAPLEVYRRPANRFVAGFIGTPPMNFLEGWPDPGNGVVTLGVRPEDLVLMPAGTADAIPAEVALVELLGAQAHVHLDAGPRRLVAVVPGGDAPPAGTRVHVRFDPARAHRFDAGGRALGARPPIST
jgi:multiple sugar transport system ATP-binding protein